MTVSSQRALLGLALACVLVIAGCAKGASTLDDTANGGAGTTGMGTGGMTGTGGTGAKTCGNAKIDLGEECDGMMLNAANCVSLGFTGGGQLSCDPNTCRYQVSMCVMPTTGNGGNGQ